MFQFSYNILCDIYTYFWFAFVMFTHIFDFTYVMFTHILTCLCDVFDDLKNVYLTFCK